MPWETTNYMTQRELFINDYMKQHDTMAALCRRYGIQRRIGYKWVERYQQNGRAGLEDLSRAPLHHPNRCSPETVERILAIRHEHPLWGAPKIRVLLEDQEPKRKPPATSTIGEILRHEGLTRPGKKRRRTPPHEQPLAHAEAPNDVVSIDFKGWFRARNGERIDPLTLIDNHSRYVLCCQALEGCDFAHVQAVMATVFHQYGLPKRIRSDNGAPFASRAIAGLSRLSIWWVKLGIGHHAARFSHPLPQPTRAIGLFIVFDVIPRCLLDDLQSQIIAVRIVDDDAWRDSKRFPDKRRRVRGVVQDALQEHDVETVVAIGQAGRVGRGKTLWNAA